MKKYWISVLLMMSVVLSHAQGIVVNADGSHSIGTNSGSGNPGVVVNANGTYSTVINSGTNISTVINSNGTLSTLINTGSIVTIVNPDGSQSVGINNGTNIQVITPDQKKAQDNIPVEYAPVKNVYWFNMLDDDDEAAPIASPTKQMKIRKGHENE